MRISFLFSRLLALAVAALAFAAQADWPQASGPEGHLSTEKAGPTSWSVVRGENIAWKLTLPETGQSTPTIVGDRVFFTTLEEVKEDSELGQNLVAWCVNRKDGAVLWQREIPGKHPLRLSGCFSDSSAPPAVCDGERVIFVNASGTVVCFTVEGEPVWQKEMLSVGRTLPFLHDGKVCLTRQVYPPEPNGNFPHKYADSPKEMWTQLIALEAKTGEQAWISECGVNMGNSYLPQKLNDGKSVVVLGRGGGHGPPEKPHGISLVDLADGSTLWTLPIEGFMATMSYRIRNDQVHIFDKGEHVSVDALTGKVAKRVPIVGEVSVRTWNGGDRKTETVDLKGGKSKRMITQGSNLLVGPWHYFRSYTSPWLGRVNVDSGKLEYLEMPLQLARAESGEDRFQWYEPKLDTGDKKKGVPMKVQSLVPNSMKNSRGFVVFGDKRSMGNGWGHVASPSPTVAGEHLYIVAQNGTIYVIDWDAEVLDEKAVVAINDLGPAGEAYTRASLSFSGGQAFAHTIRELICIGE